jgi:hypothetical protein
LVLVLSLSKHPPSLAPRSGCSPGAAPPSFPPSVSSVFPAAHRPIGCPQFLLYPTHNSHLKNIYLTISWRVAGNRVLSKYVPIYFVFLSSLIKMIVFIYQKNTKKFHISILL